MEHEAEKEVKQARNNGLCQPLVNKLVVGRRRERSTQSIASHATIHMLIYTRFLCLRVGAET